MGLPYPLYKNVSLDLSFHFICIVSIHVYNINNYKYKLRI